MAAQISIDTGRASEIYSNSVARIERLREELVSLNSDIMDLPEGANWKGDAADKFMGVYNEMQDQITNQFPQLLEDLNTNLNTNLQNLVDADAAGV